MNILVTQIYFILIITWSLAYCCGKQWNRRDKKCRQIDNDFDTMQMSWCHAGCISQWSTSRALLEATACHHQASSCIALPQILVKNTKTNKKIFLTSLPTVLDRSQNLWEFRDPKRTLYSPHRCNKLHKMWNITIGAEVLANISSYQTLSADKNWKSY